MTAAKTCGRTQLFFFTKGGSQEETGPGLLSLAGTFARPVDVEIPGMRWAPRRLYVTPAREVEHFGEHLGAAKAGRSNS
jgi:hypothetical protein